ncbi:MAG: DUF58 domain-containing protein [Actinomycetota bacterium]
MLPRTEPLGSLPFVELTSSREPATRTEPLRGQGREYLTVRAYRPGDPMRHVHWGLTARHGELMVREFEQERTPRLAIWVDTEHTDVEALDRCCTVAASVVERATATGAGIRLTAASPEGLAVATRTHHLEYHRWLARLEPNGVAATTALGWLCEGPVLGVGTLLATFPVWPGRPLEGLRAAVEDVLAVVPRVVLVPVTAAEDRTEWTPFRQAGAEVMPWAEGTPLQQALGRAGASAGVA